MTTVFGKKLKNLSCYKMVYNWDDDGENMEKIKLLREDIYKLADENNITKKNVTAVFQKLFSHHYSHYIGEKCCLIIDEILNRMFDKNLLSNECIDVLLEYISKRFKSNHIINPDKITIIKKFKEKNLMTQKNYIFMIKYYDTGVYDKIEDDCPLAHDDLTYLFTCNNKFSEYFMNYFNHDIDKLKNILKNNNMTFSSTVLPNYYQRDVKFDEIINLIHKCGYKFLNLDLASLIYKHYDWGSDRLFSINKIINIFKDFNIFVNTDFIIESYHTNIIKHIFKNNLIDVDKNNLFQITEEQTCNLIYVQNNHFCYIHEYFDIPYTQKTIEYAIMFDNLEMIEAIVENDCISGYENIEKTFKYGFLNKNFDLIEYLLNKKHIPSSKIINIISGLGISGTEDFIKILDLLNDFGYNFTKNDYHSIAFLNIDTNKYFSLEIINDEKEKLSRNFGHGNIIHDSDSPYLINNNSAFPFKNLLCNTSLHENENTRKQIFLIYNLGKIMQHIQNIEIDELCMEYSLHNPDPKVFEYIVDTYNYKPSIISIMKIVNYAHRYIMLLRFYNEIFE